MRAICVRIAAMGRSCRGCFTEERAMRAIKARSRARPAPTAGAPHANRLDFAPPGGLVAAHPGADIRHIH
jgi:hypothetical protein